MSSTRSMSMDEEAGSSQKDSEQNIDTMVSNAVIYILSRKASKQPIKRADIIKNAFPSNGRMFNRVMAKATKYTEEVFGLKVVDIDKSEKNYVTVSTFTKPLQIQLLKGRNSKQDDNNRSLLVLVLAYIFMESDTVEEGKMWQMLTGLGLYDDRAKTSHPVFGHVGRLVAVDFVRQMYLKVEKPALGDARGIRVFSWGPRAHIEFKKREILNFVSKMQSNVRPENFTLQWKRMLEEEQGAAS